jgi:MFS family permease
MWVRRLVVIAAGATFAEALFFSVLTPLLPHYVRMLGLSKYGAGVLVGSYAAGALVGAFPAGLVASTFDAKVTVIVGLGSMAALSGCFGFVSSLWGLELVRFGLGVGAAFAWTGALTWLVNEGPRGRRAELMGVATAAPAMGALLGPAVGAGATVAGIRLTFLTIALPAVLLAVWALGVPCSRKGERQPVTILLAAIRRPGLAAGLWLLVLPSFAFGVIGVLAPIRMSVLGVSALEIGAIFVLAGVGGRGGDVRERWGRSLGRRPRAERASSGESCRPGGDVSAVAARQLGLGFQPLCGACGRGIRGFLCPRDGPSRGSR